MSFDRGLFLRRFPVLRAGRLGLIAAGVAAFGFFAPTPALAARPDGYRFVSPLPGADLVSPRSAVIVRQGEAIDPASLHDGVVVARGSTSGLHTGELTLADDGRTVLFTPHVPFATAETVTVELRRGMRTLDGAPLAEAVWSFRTSRIDPSRQPRRDWLAIEGIGDAAMAPPPAVPEFAAASSACDTFPTGFPAYTVTVADNPAPGYVFFAPVIFQLLDGHMLILDNTGAPVFYRHTAGRILDFKVQPNGQISYYEDGKYYLMDASYTVVDSFATGNGYVTDLHEFQLLPNGHAMMMSYDPQPVGMDTVVVGGNPNAIVTGLILQELDAAKNVVFQWRSWDHFAITDCSVSGAVSLTDSLIDCVHGNSIDLDLDGNWIVSSRHMNEITKIDRQTGDIIWRFGGNAVNNQFTIVNDPRGFSHQHDARRLANGHLTVFDNGNYLSPEYSRALEYVLDENAMTATLAWSYYDTPTVLGPFMGNVQRLSTGGTMIGWGGSIDRKLTEIHANKSKAFEVTMATNMYTYRAFKFPWETTLFTTDVESLDFGWVTVGDTGTLPVVVRNPGSSAVTLTCFTSSDSAFSISDAVPIVIPAGDSVTVQAEFHPSMTGARSGSVYLRSVDAEQLVARVVTVGGIGRSATGVGDPGLRPVLLAAQPNPFQGSSRISFDLPSRGAAALRVYDAQGRRVRTLLETTLPAGRHEVAWDGRDDVGRNVGSGIYFVRLEQGGAARSMRVVRLD